MTQRHNSENSEEALKTGDHCWYLVLPERIILVFRCGSYVTTQHDVFDEAVSKVASATHVKNA